MPITQTQSPENKPKIHLPDGSTKVVGEKEQQPLLNITLPAPPEMDPKAPLSVGQHNACAQKNFKQVADILLAVINNQKLMGLAITEQDKRIKNLQKSMKIISENIRKFIKEDENARGATKN